MEGAYIHQVDLLVVFLQKLKILQVLCVKKVHKFLIIFSLSPCKFICIFDHYNYFMCGGRSFDL